MRRQRGYSLLEVIVAFALLAGALALLLGALSNATRQVADADRSGRAALHAQSLLDQLGVGTPLRPGRSEGTFEQGTYRWTLQVAPWQDPTRPDGQPVDPAAPRLLEIALAVEWEHAGRAQRLQLHTLRRVASQPLESL
ncbi:MAG TPA: prepilin-type N-terminal cleavage/methylation domain-containing protein [Lysobacter sp.]|nr:prepilin-type N-terminal cleavage/methylation domain-containing protein [Lysobacter sp.]